MEQEERTEICGEVSDLFFDKKIKQLNAELAVLKSGAPVIVLQDWTKEEESEDLVVLHLKEATHLKSVIENLIMDATLFNAEHVNELMKESEGGEEDEGKGKNRTSEESVENT